MNKYAGTQTEKNLEAAFAGESQARNKYTYFASVAKKEGYEQISALRRQEGGLRADLCPVPEDRRQREGACQDVVQGAAGHRRHRR